MLFPEEHDTIRNGQERLRGHGSVQDSPQYSCYDDGYLFSAFGSVEEFIGLRDAAITAQHISDINIHLVLREYSNSPLTLRVPSIIRIIAGLLLAGIRGFTIHLLLGVCSSPCSLASRRRSQEDRRDCF